MRWTEAERAQIRTDVSRWRMIVLATNNARRRRHPLRVWLAKQLRKLVVRIDP